MSTTLEILQALPMGVEVEHEAIDRLNGYAIGRHLHRAITIGFTHDPLEKELRPKTQVGISLLSNRDKWLWVAPDTLTPVLRSFPSLCTPLEDGAPAIRVAELALGWRLPDFPGIHSVKQEQERVTVCITETLHVLIDKNWDVEVASQGRWQCFSASAIIDYLRSKHFALPVNGKPLVEGVDYIRKA